MRRVLFLGMALLVLTAAAACGGDGGAPTLEPTIAPVATSTVSPTPTPRPTPTPTPSPTPTPAPTPIPPPVASFSTDVSSGSAPFTVQFSDTSLGPVTAWQWDFGDGASSTEQNPAHEYTEAGSSTVRLTVLGPGGTDETSLPGGVSVGPGPLTEVVVSPTQITLGVQDVTRLGATALDQFGNEIVSGVFTWDVRSPAGSIDEKGRLVAGTGAGTYENLVKVTTTQEGITREAFIDVAIEPGPLASLAVEPSDVALDIGSTELFTFTASDEFGNVITTL